VALFLPQKFDPRSVASRGEALARGHYQRRGCRVIATNVINGRGLRLGEIDFIALKGDAIYFVEVKTRLFRLDRFGGARHSVPPSKQRKLAKIAKLFLVSHPQYRRLRPQIDVCLVEPGVLDNGQFCVTIIPHAVDDRLYR